MEATKTVESFSRGLVFDSKFESICYLRCAKKHTGGILSQYSQLRSVPGSDE
jgi:hypothetical protein